MRFLIFIFVLPLTVYLAIDCFADTINLKNKRSMYGIVEKEDEESIVLNVGFGTVKIPKSDIESIERSVDNKEIKEKWKEKYFENFPAPTPEDQELLESFKEAKLRREEATRKLRIRESISRDMSLLQKEISSLQDNLSETGTKLKSANKKDVIKYNILVVEFNSLSAKIKLKTTQLSRLQSDYNNVNEFITNYIEEFTKLTEVFKEKHKDVIAKRPTDEQHKFYENLKKRLDHFQNELKHETISFKGSGSNILVKVLLNRRVQATMLVDTGAEITIISEAVARRLGIDADKIKQDVNLVVADGSKLAAKLTTLEAIKFGSLEGKNVTVAIVEGVSDPQIDGFLGMSFLKNFAFSIDARSKKLILNSFRPQP